MKTALLKNKDNQLIGLFRIYTYKFCIYHIKFFYFNFIKLRNIECHKQFLKSTIFFIMQKF